MFFKKCNFSKNRCLCIKGMEPLEGSGSILKQVRTTLQLKLKSTPLQVSDVISILKKKTFCYGKNQFKFDVSWWLLMKQQESLKIKMHRERKLPRRHEMWKVGCESSELPAVCVCSIEYKCRNNAESSSFLYTFSKIVTYFNLHISRPNLGNFAQAFSSVQ